MSATSLQQLQYAVVDIETTGLFPHRRDRILEVAVVRVDAKGRVLDEYVSLLNPERDLGPTHVHGIEGRDVAEAPRFAEVAGDVAHRLAGAVLVGHNVRFDAGFLMSEYARMGVKVPLQAQVCTLQLGLRLGTTPGRAKLAEACAQRGIPLENAHSAQGDARACAHLLAQMLQEAESQGLTCLGDLGCNESPSSPDIWPSLPPSGRALARETARERRSPASAYLAQLITRLPVVESVGGAGRAAYLELLDRVLEDRRVTSDEAEGLLALAHQWGLSRSDAAAAHADYLAALVAAARADGRVTEAERRDLDYAASLLDLGTDAVTEALAQAPMQAEASAPAVISGAGELRGKTVCFTGTLRCRMNGERLGREQAERLAAEAGLSVLKGVSSRLDILVVADPDTLSTKAQKARELGTRIMSDAVFFRTLGIAVE